MYNSKYNEILKNHILLRYLINLDENIALLLVLIEERCLRGTGYSSIWAQPANFVWSQSISITEKNLSRSQWWPCMIIACGKDCNSYSTPTTTSATTTSTSTLTTTTTSTTATTSSNNTNNNSGGSGINSNGRQYPLVKYHLHDEVMAVNMKRMPIDILKQLLKLRPIYIYISFSLSSLLSSSLLSYYYHIPHHDYL